MKFMKTVQKINEKTVVGKTDSGRTDTLLHGKLGKSKLPLPTLFNFPERQYGAFANLAQYDVPPLIAHISAILNTSSV